MNVGGPGGQGGAESGTGGSPGQQSGILTQILTATSAAPITPTTLITSTAAAQTSAQTSSSPSATSTSTATSSHDVSKGTIIGAVVGGVAGLILILLLLLLCLRGRKKKKQKAAKEKRRAANKEKRSTAEKTTYAGLNSAFSGVPFAHSPNREHHDSLLPAPLFSPNTSTHSGVRREETSPGFSPVSDGRQPSPYSDRITNYEVDHFPPPTDAENTSTGDPEETFMSPPGISVPTFLVPQLTRDIMGFPIDPSSAHSLIPQAATPPAAQQNHHNIESEYQDIPLSAPTPRKPIVNQNSLERLVRSGMMTPEPSHQAPNPLRSKSRALSQEFARESPVLGNRHPVRVYAPPQPSQLRRNESVRTMDSMGPKMVSDEELERLGVGIGGLI